MAIGEDQRMHGDALPPRPDQRDIDGGRGDVAQRRASSDGRVPAIPRLRSSRSATVTPHRPDTARGAGTWPTWAALALALTAVAMAAPAFIDAFSWPGAPQVFSPEGWRRDLWIAASVAALASFVLALVRAPIERRRRSRAGRWAVDVTFYLLAIGAMLWVVPLFGVLGNGP